MADDGSPVNGARSKGNAAMLDTAFLYGGSAQWLEQMQATYARDPSLVPESWRAFFAETSPARRKPTSPWRSRIPSARS